MLISLSVFLVSFLLALFISSSICEVFIIFL
nr:MAG TPA: hypothetical protein [Crassvirales sp.]